MKTVTEKNRPKAAHVPVVVGAVLLCALTFSPTTDAAPFDATCDTAHSKVGFTAFTKLFDAEGTFSSYRVSGKIDPDNLTASTVTVTVDTNTIDTGNGSRDTHLRSEDFFHVEKFPKATFTVSKIESKGGENYLITGDLTIRGTKKTLTVPATISRGELKQGQKVVRVKTKFSIKWKDFGMPWNGAFYAPDIKPDIDVHVDLNLLEPAPKTP